MFKKENLILHHCRTKICDEQYLLQDIEKGPQRPENCFSSLLPMPLYQDPEPCNSLGLAQVN